MSLFLDLFGRRFAVVASFPEADTMAANAYMTTNPETGVLAVSNGQVHIASMGDKGQLIGHKTCFVCGQPAGQHVQHSNLGTGLGICLACVIRVRDEGKGLNDATMAISCGIEGLNYEARPVVAPALLPKPAGLPDALSWHVSPIDGRALILEADGTTVCEIVAPAQNNRGDIARDLVHAQLSAVKLLAALERVVKSLADADEEGLIEHAEPMVAARVAIAYAKGEWQ